ncbi:hypothetical protein [Ruegeria faecimaris]|uniref:hypothetical protein n=1 Tax=Ruegeria faecimaris TaxID=686389 RepID=UPI00232DAC9C|nr:hypothetical protein [Ruegeria faecimaris]
MRDYEGVRFGSVFTNGTKGKLLFLLFSLLLTFFEPGYWAHPRAPYVLVGFLLLLFARELLSLIAIAFARVIYRSQS